MSARERQRIFDLYHKQYVELNFERLKLWKAVRQHMQPENVLYVGSSIHITPSFVFQNVTYVDPGTGARDFFQDLSAVKELIRSQAIYRSDPYVAFLPDDIRTCTQLRPDSYELVITGYSGAIGRYCWPYLRANGHYLSNNHEGDVVDLLMMPDAQYGGYFAKDRGKYAFHSTSDASSILPPPVSYKGHRTGQISYLENERYYLVKKRAGVARN